MAKDKSIPSNIVLAKEKFKYDTIQDMVNDITLKVGMVVDINGYYKPDDGATHKRIIANEDDGSGVQLKNGLWANIVHNGEVNVSWFGAKGDGVTDDTEAIQKATNIKSKIIYFPAGEYIINIPPGTSSTEIRYFFSVNCEKIIGNNSIIKLGTGNGSSENYRNYDGIFNFNIQKNDFDIEITGITIDYNYNDNIPTHYSGQYITHEINRQNFAFSAVGARNLLIENCTFIDHSGSNCIIYSNGQKCSTDAVVTIRNNKFLQCGHPFKYDGENAYHDVSTLYAHKEQNTRTDRKKLYMIVENNTFIGCEGNAFNAIEVSADNLIIKENTFHKFSTAILPVTIQGDCNCKIINNNIIDCKRGISIWSGMDLDYKQNEIETGFNNLIIKNNNIYINPNYWKNIKLYIEYKEVNGIVEHKYCSIEGTVNIKSINELIIENNIMEYNTETSKIQYSNTDQYCGNHINFVNDISSNVIKIINYSPKIDNLIIKNNIFKNAYNGALSFYAYSIINNTYINNNIFENCSIGMVNQELIDLFTFKLAGNGRYISKPDIIADFQNIYFENNKISKEKFNNIIYLYPVSNNYVSEKLYEHAKVVYNNNTYTSTPTNFIKFVAGADLITNIEFKQVSIDNTPPNTGLWKKNSIMYSKNIENNCFGWLCKISGNPGKWEKIIFSPSVNQLSTSYMATKMQQEGVYNDYITYMDEKRVYDKQQEKLEEQRQLAYQEMLKKNPSLSYEESLSIQPTNLNLIEEPQPSKALKQFMEKYL